MRYTIFLLLFFVFSFLFKTDSSFDQDLGRHIKLGEIIVQTHQVPRVNLFSYTNPDFPFINTHWAFEVFVYLWSITLGLQSLLILKIIIFLSSVWLILKLVPKESKVLMLPVGFIFLHVLRERLELRPEIFSFLFTAFTFYILELSLRAPKERSKLLFLLPLIQLIWINTHIYFFVGLLLQAIFLIHLLSKRIGAKLFHLEGEIRWHLLLLVLFLSIVVSLFNPNGLAGLIYPLNVNTNYGYTIVENQTMFLLESIQFQDPNFLFVKFLTGLIILSIIVAFFRRQFDIRNILLSISGLVLALLNVRSFPYLVFLSFPTVLQNFGAIQWNKLTKILATIATILLILESYFYLSGDYYKFNEQPANPGLSFHESPKKALDFVLSNNLPQPIFNNFDIGSYIIYRGYPKYNVFVDGRPEAYPAEFFLNTYIPAQSDYAKFKKLERKIGFRTIIFSHTDQTPWGRNFLQNVIKDPEWKLIYIDDFMLVLIKKEHISNLESINLAELSVKNYSFTNHVSYLRMGIFLLNSGNQISANQFLERSNQLFPYSPVLTGKKNGFFW